MLSKEDNETLVRVSRGTPMGEYMRRYWVPALLSEELPHPTCPPVRVRLLGESLVAFRDATGKVGLVQEGCPHRGASLYFGRPEPDGLRCIYHGWKFDRSGQCIQMPSERPETDCKHKVRAQSYPVIEVGKTVWAHLGPEAERPEPPSFGASLVPDTHVYVSKCIQECNYLQALEGGVDSSHVSFLHGVLRKEDFTMTATVGSRESDAIADTAPKFFLAENDYGIVVGARRDSGSSGYYWRFTPWLLPFYIITPSEKGALVTTNAYVPIDDERTAVFRTSWHPRRPLTSEELLKYSAVGFLHELKIPGSYVPLANKSNDYLQSRDLQRHYSYSGIKGIQAQDMAMIESMGPIADRSSEFLCPSDSGVIATRRRLLREVEAVRAGKQPAAAQDGKGYAVKYCATIAGRDVPFEDVLVSSKVDERLGAHSGE